MLQKKRNLKKLQEWFITVTCSTEIHFALLWQCVSNIVFLTFRKGAKTLTISWKRKLIHTLWLSYINFWQYFFYLRNYQSQNITTPFPMSQCAVPFDGGLGGVQRRLKRLLFGGCTSGSVRGFGCESRAVRWVAVRSMKTVWTCGVCRSEWRVWLETYRGAKWNTWYMSYRCR